MVGFGTEMTDRPSSLTLHALDGCMHLVATVAVIAVAFDERCPHALALEQLLEDLAHRGGTSSRGAGDGDDWMTSGHDRSHGNASLLAEGLRAGMTAITAELGLVAKPLARIDVGEGAQYGRVCALG